MKNLSAKIQSLKELQKLENNPEAETVSQLLKMMADMFKEVNQRLKDLEEKTNKQK